MRGGYHYRDKVEPSDLPVVGFAWKDNLGRFKHFQTRSREEAVRWIYSRPTSLFVAHNLEYDLVNVFRDSGYNEIDQIVYTAYARAARGDARALRSGEKEGGEG